MKEQRREDDLVDGNGEPASAAHKAIYQHIDDCKSEVLEGQQKVVEDLESWHDQHIEERHHPPLNEIAQQLGRTPTQLMQDFIRSMQTSERVVDALDGPLVEGLDGLEHRDEKKGMIYRMEDIQVQMSNGVKHKAELTRGQWAFAGTVLTVLGGILAALIGS